DDLRVPSRCAGADVAGLEDRDVVDPVTRREVVRERQAVHPAPDDHDVVPTLRLGPAEEHAPAEDPGHEMGTAHGRASSGPMCPRAFAARSCRWPSQMDGTRMSTRSSPATTLAGTCTTSPCRKPASGSSSRDSRPKLA